jgi:hypothetical protein
VRSVARNIREVILVTFWRLCYNYTHVLVCIYVCMHVCVCMYVCIYVRGWRRFIRPLHHDLQVLLCITDTYPTPVVSDDFIGTTVQYFEAAGAQHGQYVIFRFHIVCTVQMLLACRTCHARCINIHWNETSLQ